MIIFSVSIGISSEIHTVGQISAFAGVEPTSSHTKGDLIFRDEPLGPTRPSTFWSFKPSGPERPESMEPWMELLRPVLEHMAERELSGDLWRRLYVGSESKDGGSWFHLSAADLGLLWRAGCTLDIDGYDSDEEPSWIHRARTATYRMLGVYRRRAKRREKARVRARDARIAKAQASQ